MLNFKLSFKALTLISLAFNLELVFSACNYYPKIFGEETSDITFYDMDVNQMTDTIVSCG
jgi:hypothetical protein